MMSKKIELLILYLKKQVSQEELMNVEKVE
jgi:hypothetical protein